MIKFLEENQVNLQTITDHLESSGIEVVKQEVNRNDASALLVTGAGLNFRIYFDEERKFLRFSTFLPLDPSRAYESKLRLIQRFNSELFLASFSLGKDDDLLVMYYMSFVQGINLAQLMKVTIRYAELLEHIVESRNCDGMIKFANDADNNDDDEVNENSSSNDDIGMPPNTFLN